MAHKSNCETKKTKRLMKSKGCGIYRASLLFHDAALYYLKTVK